MITFNQQGTHFAKVVFTGALKRICILNPFAVARPMNASEAGGDLALMQASCLDANVLALEQLDLHNKSLRFVSQTGQGHLQPRCHSKAGSLRRQL